MYIVHSIYIVYTGITFTSVSIVILGIILIYIHYVHYPSKETMGVGGSTYMDEPVKKYGIFLNSWASKDNDDNCPYLLDKKVTDLWFEIIKDYKSEKDVFFDHWTACRPTTNFDEISGGYKPSQMLSIYAHNYDEPDAADGTRTPVYYTGDWSEQSIRDFINNFIYSDRKKYGITLTACAGWKNVYEDDIDKYSYPKDVQVVILWDKILKDYEPHPDIDFDILPMCARVNNSPDKYIKSPVLSLSATNLRLPSPIPWKDSVIKYSGEYGEQSIREFIESFIS